MKDQPRDGRARRVRQGLWLAGAAAASLLMACASKVSAQETASARLSKAEAMVSQLKFDEALGVLSDAARDPALSGEQRAKGETMRLTAGLMAGRYDQAAAAARALGAASGTQEDGGEGGKASAAAFALALEGVGLPTATLKTETLDGRRDLAGLYRVKAQVGATVAEAVIDTGANFSVLSESVAKAAGLTLRPVSVHVGSASDKVSESRLAVGDVQLGGSVLRNVVFIVMPDAALSFPMGYKISMILGMPQLARLGAVEFRRDTVAFGPRSGASCRQANLGFGDLSLYATLVVNRQPMRMMVDTGAKRSFLTREGGAKIASPPTEAELKTQKIYSAGGGKSFQAWTLDNPALELAGAAIPMARLTVKDESRKDSADGVLGQDVLSAKGGFVVDFDHGGICLID